jgi:hypothetical protein
MGRGRVSQGLSHGGLSLAGIESQIESSHEECHSGSSHSGHSSHEGPVMVGPVMGEAGHEEHQEHRHCIVAMKIDSFHFANSGRTSWSGPVPWPVSSRDC